MTIDSVKKKSHPTSQVSMLDVFKRISFHQRNILNLTSANFIFLQNFYLEKQRLQKAINTSFSSLDYETSKWLTASLSTIRYVSSILNLVIPQTYDMTSTLIQESQTILSHHQRHYTTLQGLKKSRFNESLDAFDFVVKKEILESHALTQLISSIENLLSSILNHHT